MASRIPSNVTKIQAREAREWHPVTSSNVRSICFREEHGLCVWFSPSGGKETIYTYPAPWETYISMLHAPSKGVFVHVFLKKLGHKGPFSPSSFNG